jgi:hypothetical protein
MDEIAANAKEHKSDIDTNIHPWKAIQTDQISGSSTPLLDDLTNGISTY